MKRTLFMLGLILTFAMPHAWGATTQYPNPNRQTLWNDLTDHMHTLGQNPMQTKQTLMKLHYARSLARQNSINRAKRNPRLNYNN